MPCDLQNPRPLCVLLFHPVIPQMMIVPPYIVAMKAANVIASVRKSFMVVSLFK